MSIDNNGIYLNPNDYVYSDLNARLPYVSPEDYTIVTDREAILQSVWRLLKTDVGEIPYYRLYGLDLKQFLQRPMNPALASEVAEYVSTSIETYEPRVSIYQCNVTTDYVNYSISLDYYLKIKSTDEIIALGTVTVPIGT